MILETKNIDKLFEESEKGVKCLRDRKNRKLKKCRNFEFLQRTRNWKCFHKIWKYQIYVPQDEISKVYCFRENCKRLFDPCFNDYFDSYDHGSFRFEASKFLRTLYPFHWNKFLRQKKDPTFYCVKLDFQQIWEYTKTLLYWLTNWTHHPAEGPTLLVHFAQIKKTAKTHKKHPKSKLKSIFAVFYSKSVTQENQWYTPTDKNHSTY